MGDTSGPIHASVELIERSNASGSRGSISEAIEPSAKRPVGRWRALKRPESPIRKQVIIERHNGVFVGEPLKKPLMKLALSRAMYAGHSPASEVVKIEREVWAHDVLQRACRRVQTFPKQSQGRLRRPTRHQYNFNASCTSRGEFAVQVMTPKLPPLTVVFGPPNCG